MKMAREALSLSEYGGENLPIVVLTLCREFPLSDKNPSTIDDQDGCAAFQPFVSTTYS